MSRLRQNDLPLVEIISRGLMFRLPVYVIVEPLFNIAGCLGSDRALGQG